jgi:hydrogenase nickel incorporation protein HypA/HybF
MHELSVSSAIVDTAIKHAGGRRVTRVDVQVGALRQVVPESLRFYFEIVSRDGDCDGAKLELEIVTAWMECRECGDGWDPAPAPVEGGEHETGGWVLPVFRCPSCSAADARVVRGDELQVESIEVETNTPATSSASPAGVPGETPGS